MNWNVLAKRIRVPLGFVLAILYLWLARPRLWSLVAGTAIAAGGLAIRALASGHVRKNEALATGGPYAHTRNPLYLGSIILAGGFALAAQSWVVVVVFCMMFFAIYLPVIRGEEAFLRERFPEFTEYERQVPRLVPRVGRLLRSPQSSAGAFSRELYLKHREYEALAGALAMIALLGVKLFWFRG
jgi:protein-S-isoprenylcysteine O-methyltransferase Ste14